MTLRSASPGRAIRRVLDAIAVSSNGGDVAPVLLTVKASTLLAWAREERVPCIRLDPFKGLKALSIEADLAQPCGVMDVPDVAVRQAVIIL
jgi:hypothetical protein